MKYKSILQDCDEVVSIPFEQWDEKTLQAVQQMDPSVATMLQDPVSEDDRKHENMVELQEQYIQELICDPAEQNSNIQNYVEEDLTDPNTE